MVWEGGCRSFGRRYCAWQMRHMDVIERVTVERQGREGAERERGSGRRESERERERERIHLRSTRTASQLTMTYTGMGPVMTLAPTA